MLQRPAAIIALLLGILLLVIPANAQDYVYSIGFPSFSTNIPVESGFVNVSNGNLHLEIPLGDYPQRGTLSVSPKLIYEGRIWRIVAGSGYSWQPNNVPNSQGGWRFVTGAEPGTVLRTVTTVWCDRVERTNMYIRYGFVWTDPYGTQHTFRAGIVDSRVCPEVVPDTPNGDAFATDASGYHIFVTNYGNAVIYAKDGSQVYPRPTDRNGNYFTYDVNSNVVDTLGRTPVTVTTNGNETYYDVLTTGGSRARYTVRYTTVSVKTAFGQSAVTEYTGTFSAIQSITLPDNTTYNFTYDSQVGNGNAYGTLTGISLPTGGQVNYSYATFEDSYHNKNRWISGKTAGADTWTLAYSVLTYCTQTGLDCQEKARLTRPGATSDDTVYTLRLNNGAWNTTTQYWRGSSVSGGTLMVTNTTDYDFSNPCSGDACTGALFITKTSLTATLADVGLSKRTEYTYDSSGRGTLKAIKEWDFYSGGVPASPYRTTEYTYKHESDTEYLTRNILTAQTSVTVKDGSGNIQSQVGYAYDGSPVADTALSVTHHDYDSFPASVIKRGNITQTSSLLIGSPDRTVVHGVFTYDDLGNVLSKKNANLKTANYSYDPLYKSAFLTGIQLPDTSSTNPPVTTHHTSSKSYDFSTGNITSETDENNQVTTYSYDSIGRLIDISRPGGGETQYGFLNGDATQFEKRIKISADGSLWSHAWTKFDGFGRLSQVASQNEDAGVWDVVKTACYDARGRLSFQGYPTQNSTKYLSNPCAIAGDTLGYDALDRPTSTSHSDGSSATVAYAGRASQTTSEVGVKKTSQSDAFGRLVSVCEISSADYMSVPRTGCGQDITGTGYTVTYQYSLLDNLTTVLQGDRPARTSSYDSLSRLTGESYPELGGQSVSYGYDDSGNIISRVRPKPNQTDPAATWSTIYSYDELNRLTKKEYKDTLTQVLDPLTPTAHFYYDETSIWSRQNPFGMGKLTSNSVDGSNANGSIFIYDAAGNVIDNSQEPPRVWGISPYSMTYGYDAASDVTSAANSTTGSSHAYTYNSSQQLKSLTAASPNDSTHPGTLISNIVYGPNGALTTTLGNGMVRSATYTTWGGLQSNTNQLAGGGPGTPGSATITISGDEQYYCPGEGLSAKSKLTVTPDSICSPIYWDAGTVTIQVNGFSKSATYSRYSTATAIASTLSTAFNSDTNSPVTATPQSTSILFTSKTVGAGTNYPFVVSAYTTEIDYFSGPSFTGTPASGSFTGGTNPTGPPTPYSYSLAFRTDRRINSMTGSANAVNESSNYTYDLLNHLSGESVRVYSWDFDPYANRWHQNAPLGGFPMFESFNTYNRSNDVSYDLLGNITGDNPLHTYTYDAENRIVSVDGGATAIYAYSAEGRRVKKVVGAAIREYLFDVSGNIVAEIGPTGSWTRQEIYDGGEHIATYSNVSGSVGTYFVHSDWLGTERARTNWLGTIVQTCSNLPYGDGLTCTGSTDFSPVHFTGYERDSETGLDYANSRYYNSRLGRFMTVDQLSGDIGSPQSLNRYTYVNGDPVNFKDPSGQFLVAAPASFGCPVCGIAIGIGSLIESLFGIFGGGPPKFHGSMIPRPQSNAPLQGESLGLPTGMSLPNPSLVGILLPTSPTCEFGPCVQVGNGFADSTSSGKINIQAFVDRLLSTCYAFSHGQCSGHVYAALQHAYSGKIKTPRPSGAQFGRVMTELGCPQIPTPPVDYTAQLGDVMVIQPTTRNNSGHVQVWTGSNWTSDFNQTGASRPWPGPAYAKEKPAYAVYRCN